MAEGLQRMYKFTEQYLVQALRVLIFSSHQTSLILEQKKHKNRSLSESQFFYL